MECTPPPLQKNIQQCLMMLNDVSLTSITHSVLEIGVERKLIN